MIVRAGGSERVGTALRAFAHPTLAGESRNIRSFLSLAEKARIMAALSQLPHPHSKQSAKKIIVGSEGWLASIESFEFAPRGEVEKLKLAHQGRQALAYRLME